MFIRLQINIPPLATEKWFENIFVGISPIEDYLRSMFSPENLCEMLINPNTVKIEAKLKEKKFI